MSDPFFEMHGFSLYCDRPEVKARLKEIRDRIEKEETSAAVQAARKEKAETEAKSSRKRSSTQANSGEIHQGGEFPKPARASRTPAGKKARAVSSDEDLRFTFKNKNKAEDAEIEDAETEDAEAEDAEAEDAETDPLSRIMVPERDEPYTLYIWARDWVADHQRPLPEKSAQELSRLLNKTRRRADALREKSRRALAEVEHMEKNGKEIEGAIELHEKLKDKQRRGIIPYGPPVPGMTSAEKKRFASTLRD